MSLAGSARERVVVSKQRSCLYVIGEGGDTLFRAPVCCGRGYGDKEREGDGRTPEGTFKVIAIQRSGSWSHDFKDGHGARVGAYGPWFIRLEVPGARGIGIHGTCFPESMGRRESDGCVRLRNDDVERLRALVSVGTLCTIEPDYKLDWEELRPRAEDMPVIPRCPMPRFPRAVWVVSGFSF